MNHENEYHDAMVTLLELIWGEGFMAPGGTGNVSKMVEGIDLRGKNVLDIGCGIGGPSCFLASEYGANVTGIDLEEPLLTRARKRVEKLGIDNQVEFIKVDPGPLPFHDKSFDVVLSAGAFTQTEDKLGIYRECYRVLKPGGIITCYDWMKTEGEYSDDMKYWFKMEGLTYAMETMERHKELLSQAGFENIFTKDRSEWYKKQARIEYELLKGELNNKMVELIGLDQADHFVENWRAMLIVCENGEMRQGYYKGEKATSLH